MLDYRFRPNSKFSQNFIIDEKLLEKMVESAELKKTDKVLEIGCGTGFLTEKLLEKSSVVGIEKDLTLAGLLEKRIKNKNFTLIKGDFLDEKIPKINKVVSLPPYSISRNIMYKLFELDFKLAVLVFQREFVEKLVAEPGFKEYCALSVVVDYLFESEIIIPNVSPKVFYPKPETYSSLIKLKRRKNDEEIPNLDEFILFLKQIFRYKNKDLPNALKLASKALVDSGFDVEKAFSIAQELEIDNVKVYLIETEEFVELFTRIFLE